MAKNTQEPKIQIHISDAVRNGVFSSLCFISNTDDFFVVDFAHVEPSLPRGEILARVVMTPRHLKRFAAMLARQIQAYEEAHGSITPASAPPGAEYH